MILASLIRINYGKLHREKNRLSPVKAGNQKQKEAVHILLKIGRKEISNKRNYVSNYGIFCAQIQWPILFPGR